MITLSIEALITIAGICGSAGYILGKDIHSKKK